jgi:hypothetical protein
MLLIDPLNLEAGNSREDLRKVYASSAADKSIPENINGQKSETQGRA